MFLSLLKKSIFLTFLVMLMHSLGAQTFHDYAQPFMKEFCHKCHGGEEKVRGDFKITDYAMEKSLIKDRDVWLVILEQVETEEMPTKKPFPTAEEREKFIHWLTAKLDEVDWSKVKHAGHVAMPLLTKKEYNNTLRDLLGVDVKSGDILFEDGEGESGFTTDRGSRFISPAAMEKYIEAANNTLATMIPDKKPEKLAKAIKINIEAEEMLTTASSGKSLMLNVKGDDLVRLTIGQTTIYETITTPGPGNYTFKLRGMSKNADNAKAAVRLNNKNLGSVTFDGDGITTQEFTAFMPKGSHQLTINKASNAKRIEKNGVKTFPKEVDIDWIKITGPTAVKKVEKKVTKKDTNIYTMNKTPGLSDEVSARKVLSHFLQRAFRRPVTKGVINEYLNIFKTVKRGGGSYDYALKKSMLAVLISPRFLYRYEFAPPELLEASEYPLDHFQIASRLSYFLWSTMPDKELFLLATQKKLQDPEVLRKQVKRMLADPKARNFTSTFLGQWLGFEALGTQVKPDPNTFPAFNKNLAQLMKEETILTFENLISNNLSLLELLDTKSTYLNAELARHYNIKGVRGQDMRLVKLTDPNRGGLLGMSSILTATSTPTRTSPVIRGVWVLEKVLGERIPEAPDNVPELNEDARTVNSTTLRQELEHHRTNPDCARCHDRIDPVGFGLENFDALGRFRTKENSGKAIDSKGELHGQSFEGAAELKQWLLANRKKEFTKNITERMLAFALGRPIKSFDNATVTKITTALEANNYNTSLLVEEIVLSYPFLNNSTTNEVKINE